MSFPTHYAPGPSIACARLVIAVTLALSIQSMTVPKNDVQETLTTPHAAVVNLEATTTSSTIMPTSKQPYSVCFWATTTIIDFSPTS